MVKLIRPRRKWRHPTSIERDYQRLLRAIAKALNEATNQHRALIDSLLHSRHDEADSEYILRLIKEAFAAMGVTAKALAQAQRIAERIKGYNKQEFTEVLRSAMKVEIFTAEPNLKPIVDGWTAENVRLIKSIPDQYFGKLQGVVSKGLQQGTSAKDAGREIQDLYGVTSRRAQLIARDQVATLNGLITQQRQTAVGISFYEWDTSRDSRVRPAHQLRRGKYFAWSAKDAGGTYNGQTILPPPEDGHPGIPINCRCVALPIVNADILNRWRIGQ